MWSVLLVFLSSLDRNVVKGDSVSRALDAEKPSKDTFCAKVGSAEANFLYEVSDGAEVVRSLVTSAGNLVNCSITRNPVTSFTRECRLRLTDVRGERQGHTPYERMDEARLLCQRFTQKVQQKEKPTQQDQLLRRAKRGFTYPGTLWCGAGNMADSYNQLGDFEETDSCCRTHDHCPHVIHAFSSNYGHTNFKWHSICHCDCDNTLKDCLRKVNDTSSRVVGQAFFNVIGVPCFDFAYEEQCVERHWYGLCKRYEKQPIAVLREAVPYDFGGIDVIDELTVAPSKKKDSNKSGEQVQSETTTQSTVSGSQTSNPEEPSLQNVVTAAEDFIKVLATVSTSQSSTADSEKSDAQSSNKKKKKTSDKKKKVKKTKGKGRKKKQKAGTIVKLEDSAAASLSNTKAEGTTGLSNFISESQLPEQQSRPSRVTESEYELQGKETLNEVMKDEPAMEEAAVSVTAPSPVHKKTAKKDFLSTLTSTTNVNKPKTKRLRNRNKKAKTVPTSEPESTTAIAAPSKPQEQSLVCITERQLIVDTNPVAILKVKRNRSKLQKDGEERKKRQRVSSVSSTVDNENIEDNLKEVNTLLGTPTSPEQQESAHVRAPNTSFSVLKRQRQRSKQKGLTKRKRKGPSLLHELFSQNNMEQAVPILPTLSGALNSPARTTAISRSTVNTQTTLKRKLFTTTNIPSVGRKRFLSAVVSDAFPKTMTVTSPPYNHPAADNLMRYDHSTSLPPQPTTTSANTALSPMLFTIEKVKKQFVRKKKRKVVLSTQ